MEDLGVRGSLEPHMEGRGVGAGRLAGLWRRVGGEGLSLWRRPADQDHNQGRSHAGSAKQRWTWKQQLLAGLLLRLQRPEADVLNWFPRHSAALGGGGPSAAVVFQQQAQAVQALTDKHLAEQCLVAALIAAVKGLVPEEQCCTGKELMGFADPRWGGKKVAIASTAASGSSRRRRVV
ncbi:MAG: hypothetical protein FRX49_06223 [Trebouxia sp. A1-2]|nr:MAG: hypothetical protein FRX49_06223 [Trebouxia sp. A1-2]